jgi:hypothetical protein
MPDSYLGCIVEASKAVSISGQPILILQHSANLVTGMIRDGILIED